MDDVIHLSDNCGASGYFYSGSLLTSLFSINVNVFRSPLLFLSKGASLEGMGEGGGGLFLCYFGGSIIIRFWQTSHLPLP